MFLKFMFFGSLSFGTYYLFKKGYQGFRYLMQSFWSMVNPSKFLECGDSENRTKYYAVIYGASNRAGKAYAKYLARKNFGLILIDRAIESLKQV